MSKYTFVKVTSYLLAAKYLAPIFFKVLPSPLDLNMFWILIWCASLFLFYPRILANKALIPIYIWAIYFIVIIGLFRKQESYIDLYYQKHFISWLASITIAMFYLIIATKNDLFIFIKINLILILFSCLSTIIGLQIFPEAVRFNYLSAVSPYSIEQGIARSDFFQSIGIQPYGFFYGLAIIIPPIVYYLLNMKHLLRSKNNKIKMLTAISIIYISFIQANYATAFLLAAVGIILAFIGYRRFTKYKYVAYILLGLMFFTPSSWIADTILEVSNVAENNSILQKRLIDLSHTLSGEEDTHVSARLDRIPLLIENFLSSPIWGTGVELSHNFLFDVLSAFGLIGLSMYFLVFFKFYKYNVKIFDRQSAFYFFLVFLLFAIYAPLKGGPGGIMYYFIFALSPLFIYIIQYNKANHLNQTEQSKFNRVA